MWCEYQAYFAPTGDELFDKKHCLEVFDYCLKSQKATMQESALHGIGHSKWRMPLYAEELQAMAEDYLKSGRVARPELVKFAKAAIRFDVN